MSTRDPAACPVCGVELDVVPGYEASSGRRFDYGVCDNPACPVKSVAIERKSKR